MAALKVKWMVPGVSPLRTLPSVSPICSFHLKIPLYFMQKAFSSGAGSVRPSLLSWVWGAQGGPSHPGTCSRSALLPGGALLPSTLCGLLRARECPRGSDTLEGTAGTGASVLTARGSHSFVPISQRRIPGVPHIVTGLFSGDGGEVPQILRVRRMDGQRERLPSPWPPHSPPPQPEHRCRCVGLPLESQLEKSIAG